MFMHYRIICPRLAGFTRSLTPLGSSRTFDKIVMDRISSNLSSIGCRLMIFISVF
jgi:hypothetical protein